MLAQPVRREHGRRRHRGAPSCRAPALVRTRSPPALDALEVAAVAQPQVLVTHALAAGEQAVGELFRLEVDVAAHVLEPLHRVACRVLQPQRLGHALVLVAAQAASAGHRSVELAGEPDGVLHGELGAGTDGEVRGVRRVADQHDVPWNQRSLRTRRKRVHGEARGARHCS
jgi:hypothetical protein